MIRSNGLFETRSPKPGPRVRASSISARVHASLARPRSGAVLAVFPRSCYLDLDEQIVALVAPALLNGPLNLVVNADAWADRAAPGAVAACADRVLRINGDIEIDLAGAVVWNAALPVWPEERVGTLHDNLPVLQGLLQAEAPDGGLARLVTGGHGPAGADEALERAAAPAVVDLADALRRRDARLAATAARTLAGLGPGLTPSGDDVLLGCLLALAVLPTEDADRIRDAIVSATRDRTTRISQAYLHAAAHGEAGEAWHDLIAGLAAGGTARVTGAARHVIAFGETSGSDMLAGFLLSVNALVA